MIRYKNTNIIVSTVQSTGFLNYTNADGWLLSQASAGNLPLALSDLTGTMLKNRISDFPFIPSTLSHLTGTMLKNRISDFPTIPDAYTRGQINQVLTSYGNSLIFSGSSSIGINRFRYSMNTFGNFDNGFNVRMYASISIRGTTFQEKYCFARV